MDFTVFEYTAGKSDWLAHGKPREGTLAGIPLAGDLVRTDIVTCGPEDKLRDVLSRVEESDVGFALVFGEQRVLLGVARRSALHAHPGSAVQDVMEPGPTTVRASEPVEGLVERMRQRDLRWLPVTTPKGALIGVFDRREAEEAISAGDH